MNSHRLAPVVFIYFFFYFFFFFVILYHFLCFYPIQSLFFPLRDITYEIIISCTRLYIFENKRENDRKDRVWNSQGSNQFVHPHGSVNLSIGKMSKKQMPDRFLNFHRVYGLIIHSNCLPLENLIFSKHKKEACISEQIYNNIIFFFLS